MLVLLGEVGGIEEYTVCELLKSGRISKPLVAWCIGTCSDMFSTDVQFGHAGASAAGVKETASAKNKALEEAGAVVPKNFDQLGVRIADVFNELVQAGIIVLKPETPPPPVPMDYNWARVSKREVYQGLTIAFLITLFLNLEGSRPHSKTCLFRHLRDR